MHKKKRIMLINSVIIGVALIAAAHFAENVPPFAVGAAILQFLNIIIFHLENDG